MSHIALIWHYVTHVISEISSLDTVEYIKLVATYLSAKSNRSEKEKEVAKRGYSEAALAEMRKLKEEKFSPIEILGLRFTKPLDNFKSDIFGYALLLYDNYERGHLPFPGSVSEQPAQIMEIFGTINALKIEDKIEEQKRLEADVGNKYKNKSRTRR